MLSGRAGRGGQTKVDEAHEGRGGVGYVGQGDDATGGHCGWVRKAAATRDDEGEGRRVDLPPAAWR